jgi:hypothetical protein
MVQLGMTSSREGLLRPVVHVAPLCIRGVDTRGGGGRNFRAPRDGDPGAACAESGSLELAPQAARRVGAAPDRRAFGRCS